LNQLRYDLRKLKGHGLLERDGSRYAYQLTAKGVQVALLFLFVHQRLCGPLANSRFHHQPDPAHRFGACTDSITGKRSLPPILISNANGRHVALSAIAAPIAPSPSDSASGNPAA
jgi:hypothetical protein